MLIRPTRRDLFRYSLDATKSRWAEAKRLSDASFSTVPVGMGALAAISARMLQATPSLDSDAISLAILGDPQFDGMNTIGMATPGVTPTSFYQSAMTWVRANRSAWKIEAALNVGDAVNDVYVGGLSGPWASSQEYFCGLAHAILDTTDGTGGPLPWIVAPGNHDYVNANNLSGWPISDMWKDSGSVTNHTYPGCFSKAARLAAGVPWITSSSQFFTSPTTGAPNANSYLTFTTSTGRKIGLLALEIYPPADTLAWALAVMAADPTREWHVVCHAIQNNSSAAATQASGTTGTAYIAPTDGFQGGNQYYSLTSGNSTDSAGIASALAAASNIVTLNSGHCYTLTTGVSASSLGQWSLKSFAIAGGRTCHSNEINYQETDYCQAHEVYSNAPVWGTARVAHVQILTFRPSAGVIEGRVISASTNQHVPGSSDATPLFSLSYSPIDQRASRGLGKSMPWPVGR